MSNQTDMIDDAGYDFDDIQGLVRFGNGHLSEACFLLLQIRDVSAAREWLRTVSVSTAAKTGPRPDKALHVAFTAAGLRALEVPESVINDFSEEFIAGMSGDENRSRRLGDTGNNMPVNWDWGHTDVPHVLLLLYAQAGGLQDGVATIKGSGFADAFEIQKSLDTQTLGPNEPFGFADGISQPETDWQDQLSTDLHQRDRYSNKLKVGEILLGYRNEYGLYTDRPLLDPKVVPHAETLPVAEDDPDRRDLGRNGSYLVMRQLSQDVPGFWQFIDQASGGAAPERERLAAEMVGRQRDGTPLTSEPARSVGNNKSGDAPASNQFNFDGDPFGHRCPIGAHIRRTNPRTGDFPPGVTGLISRLVRMLGFGQRHPNDDLIASARFHRLLRRGRAYGPAISPEDAVKKDAPTAERGLHFICIGANILRQFEFVQDAWITNTRFAGLNGESDPLLGNREPLLSGEPTDRFTLPKKDAPARCISGLPQFVTVRGGAYFFMPGIKALRFIATQPDGKNN